MDILILHPNFPAQFRARALEFVRCGHNVTFICQTHYGRKLSGVKKLVLTGRLGHQALLAQGKQGLRTSRLRATQYHQAFLSLSASGYRPDVIISHTGWGCGLHSAEVWPAALVIGYVEWWFNSDSELYRFNSQCRWPIYRSSAIRRHSKNNDAKNQLILQELSCCHLIVSPTYWQKHQLPAAIQRKCQVIFDGVDLDLFTPGAEIRSNVITYGTRGMEVMRGFPEFILEVKILLREFPGICVEIAGEDDIFYAGSPPSQGSWGEWAYDVLRPEILADKVRFLGRLAPSAYRQWLRSSWLHVYLTQPFVASWSLVEAMASGCYIVASDIPPVKEFLPTGTFEPVDHRLRGWLSPKVSAYASDLARIKKIRSRARAACAELSVNHSNTLWQSIICH